MIDHKIVQPKVLHVIGDSHVLAFIKKCIEFPGIDVSVTTSICYVRGLRPDSLISDNQLNKSVADYLLAEGLIDNSGLDVTRTEIPTVIAERYATGQGFERPIFIFHVGEIYVRKYLGSLATEGEKPVDVIKDDFTQVISNYIQSVQALKKQILFYPVIHELSPPTGDDALFERTNLFACPRKIRSGLYKLFNQILAHFCNKAGFFLCSISDYTADAEGCLKSEFEFDGVHADPKFASTSIERTALHWLSMRGAEKTHRYVAWRKKVRPHGDDARVSRTGVVAPTLAFSKEDIDHITQDMAGFDSHVCRSPALDWAHVAPDESLVQAQNINDSIQYAAVRKRALDIIHDRIVCGEVGEAIRIQIGAAFSIINVRAVRSSPHSEEGVAQQSFHIDSCPPEIFRGLAYLTDVGANDGAFEYEPLDGAPPIQVLGEAGTFFLFDANAVRHRATPPRKDSRLALDFIMLAHPEICEPLVHSHHGFTWPIDPFMFSLPGSCVPYQSTGRWFHPSLVANNAIKVKTL